MPKYVIKCQKFTEKQTDAYRIEVYSIWAIENMWCITKLLFTKYILQTFSISLDSQRKKYDKVDTLTTKENSLCNVYKYYV